MREPVWGWLEDGSIWTNEGRNSFSISDPRTGKKLWSIDGNSPSPDFVYSIHNETSHGNVVRIVNERDSGTAIDFTSLRWRDTFAAGVKQVWFDNNSTRIAARVNTSTGSALFVFKKVRSDAWYGAACQPEFWVMMLFAIGMICSVWRDRTALSKSAG